LKAAREEKNQITYKGKLTKITADFSTETLKAKMAWSELFQALKENNFILRKLYPAKLSFKIDRVIKIFHNEQKLKQYMTTKLSLQKILKESYTQKMKTNIITEEWEILNPKRRTDK
jgi:superfamily I DNA and RNA helicase